MWPISVLFEVFEVSRSGFDASQQRTRRGVVAHERQGLGARVQAMAASTRYSYGSRRMARALQEGGFSGGAAKRDA